MIAGRLGGEENSASMKITFQKRVMVELWNQTSLDLNQRPAACQLWAMDWCVNLSNPPLSTCKMKIRIGPAF